MNEVLLEISEEVSKGDNADLSKVNRTLDRKLEGCRSDIKRKLNECEVWHVFILSVNYMQSCNLYMNTCANPYLNCSGNVSKVSL